MTDTDDPFIVAAENFLENVSNNADTVGEALEDEPRWDALTIELVRLGGLARLCLEKLREIRAQPMGQVKAFPKKDGEKA